MRFPASLFFAITFAALGGGAHALAEDATKLDPSARVETLEPGPGTTKTVETIDKKRADRVQDSRATLAGLIEEPTAPLASRRAPIELAETREKNMIEHKDAPISMDVLSHRDSPLAGQTARDKLQTKTNAFTDSGRMAEKYQQRIRTATNLNLQVQPELSRQTTFDQFNRFVFRRNGPGTEGGAALVTAAGGGSATQLPQTAASSDASSLRAAGAGESGLGIVGIFAPPSRPPSAKALAQWDQNPISSSEAPRLPSAK
ncbi:MAG: hypothetical protein WCL04_07890 [Verrucomicrobiota bacterium]